MILEPKMMASSSSAPNLPTIIPPSTPVYHTASNAGHQALWVVCVVMALSSIAFYIMAFRVPVEKRMFHILTAFVTTFAFLSYFAMASGDGIMDVKYKSVETSLGTYKDYYREVYWARYVDWSLTTPLLLLDLCLLAGVNGACILVAVVADLIMILCGLFAAFGASEGQKWGWYTWACIAFLVIIYQLVFEGRTAAASKDSKTKAFFGAIAGFTLILWTVYPIIWGVADGARILGIDGEIIAYAVLDILAKPVFGFWLLFTHDSMTSTSPSIGGFWSEGFSSSIRISDD